MIKKKVERLLNLLLAVLLYLESNSSLNLINRFASLKFLQSKWMRFEDYNEA